VASFVGILVVFHDNKEIYGYNDVNRIYRIFCGMDLFCRAIGFDVSVKIRSLEKRCLRIMYDWFTSSVIVFLTHPGLLIDIDIPGAMPERIGYFLRGMWQATWVLIMQSFSNGSSRTIASFVYYFILLMWASIKVQTALKEANRR
jgi:hypothetical protein